MIAYRFCRECRQSLTSHPLGVCEQCLYRRFGPPDQYVAEECRRPRRRVLSPNVVAFWAFAWALVVSLVVRP